MCNFFHFSCVESILPITNDFLIASYKNFNKKTNKNTMFCLKKYKHIKNKFILYNINRFIFILKFSYKL